MRADTKIPIVNSSEPQAACIRVSVWGNGEIEVQPLAVGTPLRSLEDLKGYIDGLLQAVHLIEKVVKK